MKLFAIFSSLLALQIPASFSGLLTANKCQDRIWGRYNYLSNELNHFKEEKNKTSKKESANTFCSRFHFEQSLENFALEIAELQPSLITGSGNLFQYDAAAKSIKLSRPFQRLLFDLVASGELDALILKARNLRELDAILQKPQGLFGGLMRKKGSERWHVKDSNYRRQFYKSTKKSPKNNDRGDLNLLAQAASMSTTPVNFLCCRATLSTYVRSAPLGCAEESMQRKKRDIAKDFAFSCSLQAWNTFQSLSTSSCVG